MGRKTYESLGKPLPRRRNIVITRQDNLTIEGAEIVHSIADGLALAKEDEEVFIIGGGTIYARDLDLDRWGPCFLASLIGVAFWGSILAGVLYWKFGHILQGIISV